MSSPNSEHVASRVLRDADACVKCGLCLPQCPTYRETGHEGHSPRGRIALVHGLVTGLVPATAVLQDQLDGCLSCRRCEAVCPADVSYSRILDAGRAVLAESHPARVRGARWRSAFLASSLGPWILRVVVRAMTAMRVPALARRLGERTARLAAYADAAAQISMGPDSTDSRPSPKSIEPGSFEIRLFEGCVTRALERDVLADARTLLTAAGCRVLASPGQTCCGALARHAGLPDAAQALLRRNLAAFAGDGPIASITSGCAATLTDAADFDLPGAAAFASRVQDIGAILLPRADRLRFRPLSARVALHEPCTLTNVLKTGNAMRNLLLRIPGLEVVELDPGGGCCGAAGTYCLDQPAMADRLLDHKLAAIARLAPDLVLSANVGCTLHLVAGLRREDLRGSAATTGRVRAPSSQAPAETRAAMLHPAPAVRHPVSLLAAQLDRPPPPA